MYVCVHLVHVTGQSDEAGSDEAHNCQHGNAAMLELSLAQPPHVDPVGEAQGVESYKPIDILEVTYLHKRVFSAEKNGLNKCIYISVK